MKFYKNKKIIIPLILVLLLPLPFYVGEFKDYLKDSYYKIKCSQEGKDLIKIDPFISHSGIYYEYKCGTATTDFGKVCNSNNECKGYCEPNRDSSGNAKKDADGYIVGFCSKYVEYGCEGSVLETKRKSDFIGCPME